MKIALNFSGYIRTFQDCYKNIQNNIIEPLKRIGEVDIYFTSWDTKENGEDISEIYFEIAKIWKVKKMFLEKYDCRNFLQFYTHDYNKKFSIDTTSLNSASMWYQVQSCYKLIKESGIKYDLIVRSRYDAIYKTPLEIVDIKPNTLYMPRYHKKYEEVVCNTADQFAYGDAEIMEKYCNVYNNIEGFLKNGIKPYTGEGFLYNTMKSENIERIDFKYGLKRENCIIPVTDL